MLPILPAHRLPTVNAALRRAGEDRDAEISAALDVLGGANLVDRVEAWR